MVQNHVVLVTLCSVDLHSDAHRYCIPLSYIELNSIALQRYWFDRVQRASGPG